MAELREELVKAIDANVKPIQTSKTLYAIGQTNSRNLCPVVKFEYDKAADDTLLGHVEATNRSKTALLNGVLFVIGGQGAGFPKRVCTFNVTTRRKGRVADLEVGRAWGHSVTTSSDEIFVCGGCEENWVRSKTCEVFNLSRNRWRRLPDLRLVRSSMAVAFLPDGRLLTTGGISNGISVEFSCELLKIVSPSEGWRPVAAMQQSRYFHSAVYFEGRVFVVGGRNLTSCEVFTPPPLGSTTQRGQWTRIFSEMTKPFGLIHSTIVVSANEILVFGVGFTGDVERFEKNPTSFSEMGDFEAWSWTSLPRIGYIQGVDAIGVHLAN